MPYVGEETSMVVVLPDDGEFAEFEASLTAERLDEIIAGMGHNKGSVSFPKFEFESKLFLPDALKALGMEQAFEEGIADFSGMHIPPPGLFIKDVIHQSFVSVDEEGTEAAASTAVIVQEESAAANPFNFTANRPFIFLIRDLDTGAILFMGRFTGPEA
jgi:serpin B